MGHGRRWLAGLDQEVAATLLEESFEVVDAASAIEQCDSLEPEAGLWLDSSLVTGYVPAVSMLAGSARPRASTAAASSTSSPWLVPAGYIKVLENADADAGTFLRARDLAHEVFWRSVDAAGIGGVFEDLRSARVPLWDLPARGDGAAATTFWTDSSLDQEHWSGVPFLRTSEGGSAYRRDDRECLLPGLPKDTAPNLHPGPLGAGEVHGVGDAGGGHRLLRQRQEAWHALPRLGRGGGGQPRPAVAPGGLHEWSGTARACLQRRLPAMSKVGVPSRSTDQPGSPRPQASHATCPRRNQ